MLNMLLNKVLKIKRMVSLCSQARATLIITPSEEQDPRPPHHTCKNITNPNEDHAHFPFVMVFCPATIPGKFCVPSVCALNFFTIKLNNLNPLA